MEYPSLRTDVSCDVCVVGAGFTGIATALTLAERGYSVTVLEQNELFRSTMAESPELFA